MASLFENIDKRFSEKIQVLVVMLINNHADFISIYVYFRKQH